MGNIIDKTSEEAGTGFQILGAKKYEQSNPSGSISGQETPSGAVDNPNSITSGFVQGGENISGYPGQTSGATSGTPSEPMAPEFPQAVPPMPL